MIDFDTAPWSSGTGRGLKRLLASAALTLLALPASAQEVADTVFHNGLVYTVNAQSSRAEAVAVKDGKILAVGANDAIDKMIGASTRVVDLNGRVLMPGLIDSHMHPMGGGAQLTACNLNYAPLSVDAALEKISACIAADKDADQTSWMRVNGWFRQAMTPAGADLTAEILDRVKTARPIVVFATDFHSLAANTAALTAAEIKDDTPNPSDGEIVRDANGKATGIFLDGGIWKLMAAEPPLPAERQKVKDRADLEAALAAIRAQGVTTILDAAARPDGIAQFADLHKEGKLTVRAQFAPVISADETADPAAAVAKITALGSTYNTPLGEVAPGLSVRTGKVFMDGVIQAPAQTGALLAPYLHNTGSEADPHFQPSDASGTLYVNQERLTGLMQAFAAAGLRLHLHTDGDGAVHAALNALEATRAQYPDVDFRPAFAHCELMDPADYARFTTLKVQPILSLQWGKPAPDTIDSVKDYIGPERFKYLETAGKFQQAGAKIAFGSDWPVDGLNEWFAMEVGLTRENGASPNPAFAGRLGDDPGLDMQTALRAFTIDAAYSLGMDQEVGSIEPGKLADLIVIDRDLFSVDPHTISDTAVLLTMVGGKDVFRAEGFADQ
jgi:predicted amidohydrolase YtcJ